MMRNSRRTIEIDDLRDLELRDAHRRAFDRMQSAGSSTDFDSVVGEAVEDLIDACEAYTRARSIRL